jgi:hypothetical protein|tara:strand:+ start:620 stop:913 length:294 start_codon:yes stop_codon:yes gene_type:complete
MEKKHWSEYGKYLVLADNSKSKLKSDFGSYLKFKKVLEVISNTAYSDKSTYLYEGNIYTRKITSVDAKKILDNVLQCKWTDSTAKVFLVASQMGLRI